MSILQTSKTNKIFNTTFFWAELNYSGLTELFHLSQERFFYFSVGPSPLSIRRLFSTTTIFMPSNIYPKSYYWLLPNFPCFYPASLFTILLLRKNLYELLPRSLYRYLLLSKLLHLDFDSLSCFYVSLCVYVPVWSTCTNTVYLPSMLRSKAPV